MAVGDAIATGAFVVAGGAIAAFSSYFGQQGVSKAAREREDAARIADRELRHADYQRGTLHELQEALVELLHSTLDAGWPGEAGASPPMVLRQFDASAKVTMLTQRVAAGSVRDAVNEAAARIDEVNVTEDRTMDQARAAMAGQERAQEAIGVVLRALP